MYQVLARKWRPQTFDDLVGQAHVTTTLTNAITTERLAHAYIFAGLRGTGKTTVARILAKCLNCAAGVTVAPDGGCPSCEEIAHSRSMDVLEIDAASRTKVEQTRELLEMVSYAPVRDRFKILIIDEAHMLSKASFNALLKTLEEPPPNVMFILATTELQKILPTILSRCQVFEFRRVGVRELAAHLRKICDAEGVRVSDEALERIARAGEGSVRDSLSVLERVLAFCGEEIADEDVLRMLGGVRAEVLTRMIGAIAARDAGAMLQVLDALVDEGHDLLHFWNELLAAVRDLLLADAVPDREELLLRSPGEIDALQASAAGLTRDDLNRVFQLLADLELGLKNSSQPRFLFESTLIRLAGLGSVRPIEELLAALESGTTPAADPPPPRASRSPAAPSSRASTQKKSPPAVASPAPPDPTLLAADGLHGALVGALLEEKPMAGTLLQQATSVRADDGHLLVSFPRGQEHLAKPLQRPEYATLIESHARRLTGETLRVRYLTDETPSAAAAPVAVEPRLADLTGTAPPRPAPKPAPRERENAPDSASAPPSAPATPASPEPGDLLSQAREEPGVQKLLRDFGAQIVAIKPDSPPVKERPLPRAADRPREETP